MPTYQENLNKIMQLSVEKPHGYRTQLMDTIDSCMEEKGIEILNGYKDTLAKTIFSS